MERWFVINKKADFDEWAREFHISPVLARILRNRDLTEKEEVNRFLNGMMKDCHAPGLLKDMDKAVEELKKAIGEKASICVIGDYDVDGICSSYILTKGLKELGAIVDTVIPHRIHDGYGLNESLIYEAKKKGVDLLLTCDNGISAGPQIELAKSLGMRTIVTDHHEVPFVMENGEKKEQLPKALAVVDPKRSDCTYPFPHICGGVVAYKLIQALTEEMGMETEKRENLLSELLELAALATVCDVMELKDENRIIVKEGLKNLRRTKNLGLKALMEVNGLEVEKLSAYHLGFVIGPCLNASGRLDTALRGLALLQCEEKTEAMRAAEEVKELNDSRKNLTLEGVEQAITYIEANHIEKDDVFLIYLPEVHESLAGIIAGRIREKYNHPVFVLTRAEDGVKGSGRSIDAYHMYNAMTRVGHLFTRFGGHKLAAGLSLPEEKLEELRKALNEDSGLSEEDFIPKVFIDVPMPLCYATLELAEELEGLEPFGVGNPHPLFAQKGIRFLGAVRMGSKKNCARFRVCTPEGKIEQMIFFGDLEEFGRFLREKYGENSEEQLYRGMGDYEISVVYQLGRNTFRGNTSLQFVLKYYC